MIVRQPDCVYYKFPSYKKRYVVYAYDTLKYRRIWGNLGRLAIKLQNKSIFDCVNPYRVLEHCYIRERNGKKKYLGDEKHIYRYAALNRVYELLAQEICSFQLKLDLGEWKLVYDGVVIYFDGANGNQAEIIGCERLSIFKRLKIHIELLRQLRQGVKLKKAVKIAKRKAKTILQ